MPSNCANVNGEPSCERYTATRLSNGFAFRMLRKEVSFMPVMEAKVESTEYHLACNSERREKKACQALYTSNHTHAGRTYGGYCSWILIYQPRSTINLARVFFSLSFLAFYRQWLISFGLIVLRKDTR